MGRRLNTEEPLKKGDGPPCHGISKKVSELITIAAKEGGPDPEMNSKLRLAIQTAKSSEYAEGQH